MVNILYVLMNCSTVQFSSWRKSKYRMRDYSLKNKKYEGERQFTPGLCVINPTFLYLHCTSEGSCLLRDPFSMFYCEHQQLVLLTLGRATHAFQTKSNGRYTSIQYLLGHILFRAVSPFNLQEFLKSSSYDYFSGLFFGNIFLLKEYRQLHAMMHFLMQNIFSKGG